MAHVKAIPVLCLILGCLFFSMGTLPAQAAFYDDMESGTNGWTATGFWHQVTSPQLIRVQDNIRTRLVQLSDAGFLPGAYSGTTCWWYGENATGTFIGADYDTGQSDLSGGISQAPNTGNLVSPAIDLAGMSSATLSFFTWWEIEGVDVDRYDYMHVEVSTDGGTSYTLLANLNPLNDVNSESYIGYSTGGINKPGEWGRVYLDLTPYVGQTIHLQFRFDTVDAQYNGFRGWFIDDVRVNDQALPTLTVSAVEPAVARAGDIVTVHGSGFLNGATVYIGGQNVGQVVIFNNKILCTVPALTNGTYDVTVTNPDLSSATLTDGLTVSDQTPPTITAIVPWEGLNTGTTAVTITGTGFVAGAVVKFDAYDLTDVVVADPTTITATVPAGLPVGFKNVVVINPDGLQGVKFAAFEVTGPSFGSISGHVVDSQTGQALEGVTITLTGSASDSTTTDAGGDYDFADLAPGSYTVTATLDGYTEDHTDVAVNPGLVSTVNFALSASAALETYRIVLTWADLPSDLDSHLYVPYPPSDCYHVYWSDKGSEVGFPYAWLDIDDIDSYGPETITIVEPQSGVYQYWVHNYSGENYGEPDITTSQAVVKLYKGDTLIRTYTVPTSPTGFYAWHVFDLNAVSGYVTDVNIFEDIDIDTYSGCTNITCTYDISRSAFLTGGAGGEQSVDVTADEGCAWSAISNVNWITLVSDPNGVGNGTVTFNVAPNTSGGTRIGQLTVAGQTVTVTQTAGGMLPIGAMMLLLHPN